MRLIDADSFLKDIKGWQEDIQDNEYDANKFDFVFERIYEMFEEIPTAYSYNKAIDDFAEKLKSECREHYIDCDPYFCGITDSILYEDDIDEIAEQLKAGGKNV